GRRLLQLLDVLGPALDAGDDAAVADVGPPPVVEDDLFPPLQGGEVVRPVREVLRPVAEPVADAVVRAVVPVLRLEPADLCLACHRCTSNQCRWKILYRDSVPLASLVVLDCVVSPCLSSDWALRGSNPRPPRCKRE